ANSGAFQHCAHATSCKYSGTTGGRFNQYFCCSVFSHLVVRNSTVHNRNPDQVLFGILNTFGDGFLNFFSLTQSMAYYTIFISHYNKSRKTESTASFGSFHHAIDGYNSFFKFQVRSEERRVGKECKARDARYKITKKESYNEHDEH